MTPGGAQESGNGLVAPKYTVHTLHTELNRRFARKGVCIGCNTDGRGQTHYALIHGRAYSLNAEDYIELCTQCHNYYDYHSPESTVKCSCHYRGRYTHGTAYADIVREDLPLRKCAYAGCRIPFYPRRINQIYHDKRCGGAAFRLRSGIERKPMEMGQCQRNGCLNLIPVGSKATARYCSNSCKQLAYRERRLDAKSAVD